MAILKPKISIIGCGNVGMRYIYALIAKGIAREIVIVDPNKERLIGEVMDLSHGAPYYPPVEIIGGDYSQIKNSDLIVITAGKKQKQGQSRIDLLKDNVELYKIMIPEVVKYAPDAIILVVSNPVDILSYAAYRISKKPAKEVIGSGTVLDTARLRYILAKNCDIDPRNVHSYILGEHGDSEFPVWSRAMIGGVLLSDYCLICKHRRSCKHDEVLNNIFTEVRDSAYKIIEKKGETSYGIGLALVRITQAIIHNENAVLPVSSLIDGYMGVNDVYLSLPAIVNKEGIRTVLNIEFDEKEKQAFMDSADKLKGLIKEIGL